MKTTHIHNGTSIQADDGTHASRLFHAILILRGRHFWDAYRQGVMAGLKREPQRSPFPYHITPDADWNRGYDAGRAALNRMSARAVHIRARLHPEWYYDSDTYGML